MLKINSPIIIVVNFMLSMALHCCCTCELCDKNWMRTEMNVWCQWRIFSGKNWVNDRNVSWMNRWKCVRYYEKLWREWKVMSENLIQFFFFKPWYLLKKSQPCHPKNIQTYNFYWHRMLVHIQLMKDIEE